MRIKELESLFQEEENLDAVLEEVKTEIAKVDEWAELMRDGQTQNPEMCKQALSELTGVFMRLAPVLSIAVSEKKNREVRGYNKIKMETEQAGKKFVSASTEKLASEEVSDYRRLRNYIQSYVDSCKVALSSLQSTLKQLQEEAKLTGKEE